MTRSKFRQVLKSRIGRSGDAMRTPALWLLALATGMMFFMHAGSNTHAAAFFQDQGLGAVTAGVSISLNAIFLGISSLFWGRIVERVPARFVMAGVALNLAIGAFLFTLTDTTVRGVGILGALRFRTWRDAGGAASGVCGLFRQEFAWDDTGYHRAVYDVGSGCGCDDPGVDLRLCWWSELSCRFSSGQDSSGFWRWWLRCLLG